MTRTNQDMCTLLFGGRLYLCLAFCCSMLLLLLVVASVSFAVHAVAAVGSFLVFLSGTSHPWPEWSGDDTLHSRQGHMASAVSVSV